MAFSPASREHCGILCCFMHCTHVHALFLPGSRQMTLWLKESPLKVLPMYLFVDMLGFERHTWWNLQVGTC